jgi:hypothetical protein
MKRRPNLLNNVFWISICLLFIALPLASQQWVAHADPQDPPQPANLIALRVVTPTGEEVRATVLEGGSFSIEDQTTGEYIAFFPSVSATNRRNIQVKVYQGYNLVPGQRASSGNQYALNKVDEIETEMGVRKNVKGKSGYIIEVEAIIRQFLKKKEAPGTPQDYSESKEITLNNPGGGDMCCISCNGKLYCSNCSVETPCGCCHTIICTC